MDPGGHETQLAAPAVAADLYDQSYYLEWCAGYPEWAASGGAEASALYAGSLEKAGFRAGEVVVDLGCGRGELLAEAVDRGAPRAIGVEYSEAALALARTTLHKRGVEGRAEVLHADARAIPVPDGTADLVTMLDVVEHLTPEELDRTLAEVLRITRPGGRVLVHTLPNRLIYDVTYRAQRMLTPDRLRSWPKDPRIDLERLMHVNEQTRRSLAAALGRAGFADVSVAHGLWIHDNFVPDERARGLYRRLAAHRPTRALGAADLWGRGRRP
jgi:SAM-dependent methyltransferase